MKAIPVFRVDGPPDMIEEFAKQIGEHIDTANHIVVSKDVDVSTVFIGECDDDMYWQYWYGVEYTPTFIVEGKDDTPEYGTAEYYARTAYDNMKEAMKHFPRIGK